MPFAAAVSNRPSLDTAIAETSALIQKGLKNHSPDLTCVFISHHFAPRLDEVSRLLQSNLGSRVLIGCTGEAIVSGSREYESEPALSLWSCILPGAELTPFYMTFEETPDGLLCSGIPGDLGDQREQTRSVLFLGDPYTSSPQSVIELLGDELPGVPVVGGMASGGAPGENRLYLNDESKDNGAIGIIVRGGPQMSTIVSQGCRPIGTPFVVTKADRNVIYELGGLAPLQRLETLFHELPARDQQLVEHGVHLGVVMNEYQDSFHRGDFLIVNVHGVDRGSGALATGGLMRVGQTVQFHIRDADTADEDLQHLLKHNAFATSRRLGGALLFTCNGRGTRMFPTPNHDASAVQQVFGPFPMAGFFAQGELGPVGGKNYVHGFTASLVLFEEA